MNFNLRIAIVEEDLSLARRLKKCMDQTFFDVFPDYKILLFPNAAKLRKASSFGERFHLFFFDTHLPDENGIDLAKDIRFFDEYALFVFIGSARQEVFDALQATPTGFLCRDSMEEHLADLLKDLALKIPAAFRLICFPCLDATAYEKKLLSLQDISAISLEERHLVLYRMYDALQTSLRSFPELPFSLKEQHFYLINRSTAINLRHVDFLDKKNRRAVLTASSCSRDLLRISGRLFRDCQQALEEFRLAQALSFLP